VVGHHWAPLYYQSNADFVNGKLIYDHGEFKRGLGMAIDFDNKEV
jgi:hypothetical protein